MVKVSIFSSLIFFLLFGCTNKEKVLVKKNNSETQREFLRRMVRDTKRFSNKLRNLEISIEVVKFHILISQKTRNDSFKKWIKNRELRLNKLLLEQKLKDKSSPKHIKWHIIALKESIYRRSTAFYEQKLKDLQAQIKALLEELKINLDECILHNSIMNRQKVSYCGKALFTKTNNHSHWAYSYQLRQSFPNANEPATRYYEKMRICDLSDNDPIKITSEGPVKILKYVCSTCNQNRDKWFKEKGLAQETASAIQK